MIHLLLKNILRTSVSGFRRGGWRRRIRTVVTLAGVAVLPTIIILQTRQMFHLWLQIPQFGVNFLLNFLSFSFLGLFLLLFFSGFTGALHHFFLAADLSLLLTLPADARTVFKVKYVEASFSSLAMFVAIGLPLLISMLVAFNAGAAAWLLLVPLSLIFVLIPTGLSIVVALALAPLFSVPKMRRVAVFMLGIFFILGWAGLQFLRLSRFNPGALQFDPMAVDSFSQTISRVHLAFLPSDWLLKAAYSILSGDWSGAFGQIALLTLTACFLIWGTTSLRARQKSNLPAEGSISGRKHGQRRVFNRLELPVIMFLKEIRMIFRDMRALQGYFLFTAIMIVWPFLQGKSAENDLGTISLMMPYIGLLFIAVAAVSGMSRQALPLERRSFQYVRLAPVSLRWTLVIKAVVPVLLLSIATIISVAIASWRSGASLQQAFIVLISFMAIIVAGSGGGLVCGALFGKFDWTDPRHMLHVGWSYLSLLLSFLIAALGFGILAAGYAMSRLVLAFVIFFGYVSVVFWMAILLSEKRLTKVDWI
jgi:hypothetical protein